MTETTLGVIYSEPKQARETTGCMHFLLHCFEEETRSEKPTVRPSLLGVRDNRVILHQRLQDTCFFLEAKQTEEKP